MAARGPVSTRTISGKMVLTMLNLASAGPRSSAQATSLIMPYAAAKVVPSATPVTARPSRNSAGSGPTAVKHLPRRGQKQGEGQHLAAAEPIRQNPARMTVAASAKVDILAASDCSEAEKFSSSQAFTSVSVVTTGQRPGSPPAVPAAGSEPFVSVAFPLVCSTPVPAS